MLASGRTHRGHKARSCLWRTVRGEEGRLDDEQCLSLCFAVLWYAMLSELLCALAGGIVEGEGKSSNHAVVLGSRAVVVHVGNGGVSLGVLRETNEALTTICRMSVMLAKMKVMEKTYGLLNLDLAELFELAAKSLVIGVPGEATAVVGVPCKASTAVIGVPCKAAARQPC